MGKLVAVRTTEALAELIEKSGVLAGKSLDQAKLACAESADLKTTAQRLIGEKLLTLWQAKQLLGGFSGLMLGKFKLLDEIGRGGLGRVYLAEQGQLGGRASRIEDSQPSKRRQRRDGQISVAGSRRRGSGPPQSDPHLRRGLRGRPLLHRHGAHGRQGPGASGGHGAAQDAQTQPPSRDDESPGAWRMPTGGAWCTAS